MAEKEIIFDNLAVTYKGIFSISETLGALHKALRARGYQLHEKKTEQLVHEKVMTFFHDLRTTKRKNNFYQLRMYIKFIVDDLTEEKVEIDGFERTFQKGDLQIVFDTYTHTDWQNRWNQKPYVSFLYQFINKFIYEFPLDANFHAELIADTRFVYDQMRAHLRLYKYKAGVAKKEAPPTQLP